MKKLILKILSQKKLGLTVIAAMIALIVFSIYFLNSITNNVQKMADAAEEAVLYYPEYPAANTTGKNAELIKRGELLAKAGDCMACHTNTEQQQKAKPFAGGLPMYTPFGTIYSPNISPDKETGIGSWTEDEFIKAMRAGISPKGHYYYPAFPYLYFSKISTDDLKALKAYLDSVPPVRQQNLKNDMVFPFNIRFLQFGWRILFFHPENTQPYENNPERSAQWNRGAYLAEGLGHCAMCHSPSYHILSENLPLGAPIRKYDLTGAKVQGFLAPNITKGNLDKVSVEEIIEVFTKDRLIGGGKVEGPMLEVNHDSLRHLPYSDLESIAIYLKEVNSATPPKPKPGAGGIGKSIYDTYCSGCHASGAGGAPKYGDASTWEDVVKQSPEKIYANAIDGKGSMPAKGTCISCNDDEIKQTVDYMLASIKGKAASASTAKPKPLSMEDGKRLYEQNCAVCHNAGFKGALKPGDKAAWKPTIDQGFLAVYHDVLTGEKGHPPHGACASCSDAEIKAALKYMMKESSTGNDFSLW